MTSTTSCPHCGSALTATGNCPLCVPTAIPVLDASTQDVVPKSTEMPSTLANTSGTHGAGPADIAGYELLGILGRGGMGIVYKARHLTLKRTVALKMVLSGSHAGPQELDRFRAEAESVARLQHPHIVQVFEVG